MPRKAKHGGARKGAGRPSTKGVTFQLKITPAQKAWIISGANAANVTLTDYVLGLLVERGMPPTPLASASPRSPA